MSAFSFNGLSRVLTLKVAAIGMAAWMVLLAAYWHGKRIGTDYGQKYPEFSASWVEEAGKLNEVVVKCGDFTWAFPERHKH